MNEMKWNRLVETLYPHAVRASWRRLFVREAQASVAPTVAVDQIWDRLNQELSFADEPRLSRASKWAGGLALAASVCLALWGLSGITEPAVPTYDGIKSSGTVATAPMLKAIRFAVVNEAGQLIPGEHNMRVAVGTPLVFSLESQGASEKDQLSVELTYQRLPFALNQSIAKLHVTNPQELVRGDNGYVAFTPDQPGPYIIRASSLGEGESNAKTVSVNVRVFAP